MGLLQHGRTGRLATLVSRSLVGRAPSCEIVLDDPRASGEHAVVTWGDDGWHVRDLGSRNGTWIDGSRLPTGERCALRAGGRLGFGMPDDTWQLADASGPAPVARCAERGDLLRAVGGLLALPAATDPRATIFFGGDGHWVMELDGGARRVTDQEVVSIDGRAWTLLLPSSSAALPGTVEADPQAVRGVATIGLRFRVSSDEENVDLTMQWAGGELALPPRSSHYTLLTLARARLEDVAAGVAPGEQGWLHAGDLARMLDYTAERLNIEIYRARALLAKAGVADAARLIERRPLSRHLRIGVDRLEVRRA